MNHHPSSTVRGTELRELLNRITSPSAGPVVVRAPAGMGKTTLLEAVHDRLRDHAIVRFVRPTEAEQHVPFTALADLLADVPPEWYDDLPAPQRRAIRTALLLEETEEEIDPRAVAAALAGVAERSGERRPVVMLVDDAQWLDPASRTLLVAALRWLRHRRVALVVATRPTVTPVESWLPGPLDVLDLDPLGRDRMGSLLRSHLGAAATPAAVRTIVERSGGNPLFALQLARHDADAGRLDDLISRQVLALPFSTRMVVLTAALAVDRSIDTIAGALDLTPLELCEQLDPARTAGILRTPDTVQFEHPLFAEAVVALAARPERDRAHRGLAAAEPDADARVAHRAAVTTGTDDDLADQLEAAARNVRRRGAWDRGTDLLTRAVELTPPGVSRLRRQGMLGEWLVRTGQPAAGEDVLDRVRREAVGDVRHRATLALADLLLFAGRPQEAGRLVVELQHDDVAPEIRAQALLLNPLMFGDRQMLARAERAQTILAAAPSTPAVEHVRTAAMTLRARCLISAAEQAEDVLAEAVAREGEAASYAPLQSAAMLAASNAHWGDHHEEAERGYRRLVTRALDAGDEESLPTLLAFAACNNIRWGVWDRARQDLEDARSAIVQHQVGATMLDVATAWILGHTGAVADSLDLFDQTAPVLERLGPGLAMYHRAMLGEVLLGAERYDDACRALNDGLAQRRASDTADPGVLPLDTDWIEAAIALGDLTGAAARLDVTTERAKRMGRDNVVAACERVRLVLLAVGGAADEAAAGVPALLEAYDAHDRRPLDRGRAHLAAAEVLRRARSRRGALEQLTRAQEVFAASGHETFRRRAERTAARLSIRGTASAVLTGAELRTAQLAASGLRNKEIAAALFVDLKTVESTLTRVYRKLGVRSRVDLARALPEPA